MSFLCSLRFLLATILTASIFINIYKLSNHFCSDTENVASAAGEYVICSLLFFMYTLALWHYFFDDADGAMMCRQGMTKREKKTAAEKYAEKYKDLKVHQNLTRVMYFT